MAQQSAAFDRRTKIFFSIFFLAILGSIALTFYTLYVEKNYTAYTEEDTIPEPLDLYIGGYESLRAWLSSF
jgi:hypothetical protein